MKTRFILFGLLLILMSSFALGAITSTDITNVWEGDGNTNNAVSGGFSLIKTANINYNTTIKKLGTSSFDLVTDNTNNYLTSNFQDYNSSFSIEMWVYLNGWSATNYAYLWSTNATSGAGAPTKTSLQWLNTGEAYWRDSVNLFSSTKSFGQWYQVVVTYNRSISEIKYYINNTLVGTNNTADNVRAQSMIFGRHSTDLARGMNGYYDSIKLFNRALTATEVTTLWNGGVGKSYADLVITPFSITVKDFYDNTSLTNFSVCEALMCGATTITTTNGTVTTPLLSNDTGLHNITIWTTQPGNYFNRTYANLNVSTNLAATLYRPALSYSANANIIEKSSQTYTLNVYSGQSVALYYPNSSATFYFNGTAYNSSIVNGTNLTFYSYLTPDLVGSGLNYNVSTYWTYNLSGYYRNSSIVNQTISRIYLDNCTNTTNKTLNFLIKDETSLSLVNGSTLGIYFDVWYDSILNQRNYSLSYTGEGNYSVCIYPTGINYTTNAQMQYGATGYTTKYYYLTNAVINSVMQTVNLYLTNGTTLVQYLVIDSNYNPVSNVTIKILSYDLATNSYITTEMVKTDSNGYAYSSIVLNTVFYKFILEQNGVVVLETTPSKVTSAIKTFQISGGGILDNLDNFQQVTGYVIYDNTTGFVSFTFNDPSGLMQQGCLKVTKTLFSTETVIANSCQTSTGTTILVNISGIDKGRSTFTGSGFIYYSANEKYLLDSWQQSFDEVYKSFGNQGLFITFMLVVTLTMVGLWSPVVATGLMAVAFIASILMGIFIMTTGVFIGFLIVIAIYWYRSK